MPTNQASTFRKWRFKASVAAVGIPALTFPLQNILVMVGVQNLSLIHI